VASYRTPAGRRIRLGTQLGKGAGGVVHLVEGQADVVAKVLTAPTPQMEARLRAMLAHPIARRTSVPGTAATIAWPTELLLDAAGRVRGYLMPLAPGPEPKTLFELMNRAERERFVKNFSWRTLLRIALHAAAGFSHLEANGIIVGDCNESNVMAAGDAHSTVIDPDSMQFVDASGTVWLSPFHKAQYLAPELVGVDLHRTPRRFEHDRYAFAVLIFQLLMEGFHPHDGVAAWASSSVGQHDHARDGRFAYSGKDLGFRPPRHAPPWEVMPNGLRVLFERAFTAGARNPAQRPSPAEWQRALAQAIGELRLCTGATRHYYPANRRSCPWCAYGATASPAPSPTAALAPAQPARGFLARASRLVPAPPPPPPARPRRPSPPPPPAAPPPAGTPPLNWSAAVAVISTAARMVPSAGIKSGAALLLLAVVLAIAGSSGVQDQTAPVGGAPSASVPAPATPDADSQAAVADEKVATEEVAAEEESEPDISPRPAQHTRERRRPGPAMAVKRHFEYLAAGQPQRAFRLMSPRYRRAHPRWPAIRGRAQARFGPIRARVAAVNGREALVFVRFRARDTVRVRGSDTHCRRFTGRVHVIRVGNRWRYDPIPSHGLNARVVRTSGACP
jgi:DNA-binding helix-hairpin-helix protein with protein kinase domain